MFVRVPGRARRRVRWATSAVAAIALCAFVWQALLPEPAREAAILRFGTVPAELFGGMPSWLNVRELPTIASALFVHADWPHLVGNLAFLLIFGLPAERVLGSRRLLALFLLCGMLSILGAAALAPSSQRPIVGMSGAVSGLVGAYVALFPRARLGLVLPLGVFLEFVRIPALALIGFWILVQAIFAWLAPDFGRVAWGAHLVGFIAGVLFALASRDAIARRQRNI